MLLYIIRRILLFIPALFFITLAAFFFNSMMPGDPVMRLLGAESERQGSSFSNQTQYDKLRHELGIDLPLFYFSFTNLAAPDSIFIVTNASHKKMVQELSSETGNGDAVLSCYIKANNYLHTHDGNSNAVAIRKMLAVNSVDELHVALKNLSIGNADEEFNEVLKSWNRIDANHSSWKKYIPVIKFHSHNQYQRWLFGNDVSFRGILKGDFGKSLVSGKNVSLILKEKLGWTIFFTLGGILISLAIAIPAGVYAGRKINSGFDKYSSRFVLLLHSLPSFFTATLLLMLFANPSVLGWFPASGTGPANETATGILQWLQIHIPYFILPLICYALASLPFILRAVRSSMADELDKDYIVTARAKGLSEKRVIWNHAFRNALFPLITLVAWLFPAMIGGSAILETVFSIPGLGLEIVQGITTRDYPLIIAVFTFTGILTVTGYLVSDILYMLADPRVELK
ncbi:MAG: ABC transporter permease [Bacteroidota bacterium]